MAGIKGMTFISLLVLNLLMYDYENESCLIFTNNFCDHFTFTNHIFFSFMLCPSNFAGLVSLAFAGSIGMTFVILACALPQFKLWWPFFVVLFYILCPIPTMIARRHTDGTGGTNSSCMETAIFITMGIIVSSFALPIVLARASVILWPACYLTLAGNVIVYLTIIGFFTIFDMEDSDYAMW